MNCDESKSPADSSSLPGTSGRRRTSVALTLATAIWLGAIVAALVVISNFSSTPGTTGSIPLHWPAQTRLPFDASRPTLVMFAHPHCPCTRASLGELDVLMARCQGKVSAHVVFIRPEGTAADWMKTDLWKKAAAIPGVSVHCDNDGVESRLFQSETSGQTLLYDEKGNLLFQGGITISRGHSGDNPGRSALVALLDHQLSTQVKTPVFGCSLFNRSCRPGDPTCNK
jgi:hypothetical protein